MNKEQLNEQINKIEIIDADSLQQALTLLMEITIINDDRPFAEEEAALRNKIEHYRGKRKTIKHLKEFQVVLFKPTRKAVIEDVSLVPVEYLKIDYKYIRKTKIPGVRFETVQVPWLYRKRITDNKN